jgi:hypothetical protein
MIIDCFVFWPIIYFHWRDSIRSEAELKTAPECTESEQTGCRREIPAVFKEHYTLSPRGNPTTHYVSMSMSDPVLGGDIPIQWDDVDHSLYSRLKPGDQLTAEEWEGQIVVIRDANGSLLLTEYDPTYMRRQYIGALIGLPLVALLVIFLEYKLIRWLRKTAHS